MPHVKRWERVFLAVIIAAIFLLSIALILLMTRPARADSLPDGITCEMVREKVAEHGKVKALTWAIEHGISIRQIWQIRRTCKV